MKIVSANITGSLTLNNVDITTTVQSSSIWSGSFSTRVTSLESFSSSLDATYATDAQLTSVSQSFNSSISILSGSLEQRITNTETTSSNLTTASGSFSTRVSNNEATASSLVNASSSFSTRVSTNETNISNLQTASGSFSTRVSSLETASGSFSTRVSTNETNITNLQNASSSFSTRVTSAESSITSIQDVTGSYATTGSNNFVGNQRISSTNNAIGFTSTASLYADGGLRVAKDAYISGTLYLNNLIVYGTQSVQYITASQLNISTNIISVNTDTPSIRYGGLSVYDSGSTGLTGSLLWDSEQNHWIYTNPSGSSYSGGMLISGPRASALGAEQGTTCNALMKGQGGDHITSSGIFDYGTCTSFYGNASITNTGAACFASNICATNATFNGCVGVLTGNQIRLYNSAKNNWTQIESPLVSGDAAIDLKITTQTGVVYMNNTGITCFNNTVCTPALVVNKSNPVLYINAGNNEISTIGFTQGAVAGYGGFIKTSTGLGDRYMSFGLSAAGTNNDATEVVKMDDSGVTCFLGGVCAPSSIIKGTINEQLVLDFVAGAGSYTHQSFRLCGTNQYRLIGNTNGNFVLRNDIISSDVLTFACAGAVTFACKIGIAGASATYPLTVYNGSNGTTAAFGGTTYGIRIDNDGTFSCGRSTIYGVDASFYGSYQPLAIGASNLFFSISGTDRFNIGTTGIACFACQVCTPCVITNKIGVGGVGSQLLTVRGIINSETNGDYYGAWLVGTCDPGGTSSLGLGPWYSQAGYIQWVDNDRLRIYTCNATKVLTLQETGGGVAVGATSAKTNFDVSRQIPCLGIVSNINSEATTDNQVLAQITFFKHYGIACGAAIKILQAGGINNYAQTHLAFYTTNDGNPYTATPSERLRITSEGSAIFQGSIGICNGGAINLTIPNGLNGGSIRMVCCTGANQGDMYFTSGGGNGMLIAGLGNVGIGVTSPNYTLQVGGRGYFFATNQDAGWGMLTLDYGNGTNSNIYAIQMAEGGAINAAIGFGSYGSPSNCGDLVMWTNSGGGLVERSRMYSNGAAKIASMGLNSTTILQKSFSVGAGACVNVCFDLSTDIPGRGTGYVFQADIHVGGYGSAGASGLLYKASVAGYDGHYVGIGSYHKDAELVKCASGVDVKIYNPSSNSNLLGITIYNCNDTYGHTGTFRMVLTY